MSLSGKNHHVIANSDVTRQKKGRLTINQPTNTHAAPLHPSEHKSSSSINMLRCHQCPFETKYNKDLVRHLELHEHAVFTCSLCNWPSRSKNHMTSHERQVHDVGHVDEKFLKHCQLCTYTTLHFGDLARHKRKHLNVKFSCKVCNYPFMNEKIMEAHVRKTHTGKDALNARVKDLEGIEQKLHGNMNPNKNTKNESTMEKKREHDFQSNTNIKETYVKDSTRDSDTHKTYTRNSYKRSHGNSVHEIGDENATKSAKGGLSLSAKKENNKKENSHAYTSEKSCNNKSETHPKKRKHSEHSKRHHHNKSSLKDNSRSEESIEMYHKHSSSKTSHKPLTSTCTSDTRSYLDDFEMSESVKHTLASKSKEFETMTIFLDDKTSVTTMKCLKCVYLTTNKKLFQEHMQKHKCCSYECRHCHMPFLQQNELQKHKQSAHNTTDSDDIEIISPKEGTESESVTSLESEKYIDIELSVTCASPFESEDEAHVIETEGEIKCAFCEFKTISYVELKEHIVCHVEVKHDVSRKSPVEDENDSEDENDIGNENYVEDEHDVRSMSPEEDENDAEDENNVEYDEKDAEDENNVEDDESDVEDENVECINSPSDEETEGEDENDVEDENNVENDEKNVEDDVEDKNVVEYENNVEDDENDDENDDCSNGFDIDGYEDYGEGDPENKSNDHPEDSTEVSNGTSNLTNQMDMEASDIEEELGIDDEPTAEDENEEHEPKLTDSEENIHIDTSTPRTKEEKKPVTGNVTKEEFKRTRKLYRKISTGEDGRMYECLVCTESNRFKSAKRIWLHFKKHHKKLRRRICSSCPYCSKPFPKLK